jgi:hypothetical protein
VDLGTFWLAEKGDDKEPKCNENHRAGDKQAHAEVVALEVVDKQPKDKTDESRYCDYSVTFFVDFHNI